jgi:hypothetical protein
MSIQPADPLPPQKDGQTDSLPSLLTYLLINYVSPLLDKTGSKWKFTTGFVLLNTAWILKAFLAPKYPELTWIPMACEACEYLAGTVCGLGVVHRALKIVPK